MTPTNVTLSSLLSVCPGYDDKIQALVSRNLSNQEESLLHEHLHSCHRCLDYFNFLNIAEKKVALAFTHEVPSPNSLPYRLRDDMGESIRKSLASWLMEAGKSLLLSDARVRDWTYFKDPPFSLKKCTTHLTMIIGTIEEKSRFHPLELDSDYLSGCCDVISKVSVLPSNYSNLILSKDILDNSLTLFPHNPESTNLLGLFHHTSGDLDSSIKENHKALKFSNSVYFDYFCNHNISSSYFLKYDFANSIKHLEICRNIRNDGLVQLSFFLITLNSSSPSNLISKCLMDLTSWIETEKSLNDQSQLIRLLSLNIFLFFDYLKYKINDSEPAFKIAQHYYNLYLQHNRST